ncbi:hypothetical protein BJ322DRAFT_1107705 [Thelephora terrestris]|uniref:Transmembrane protein n=1 Tax=Thelephora terrestris TaxID=56493 RepID=A0A9P6L7L6_9AGAM|nr:hypothetical protein BJ322DRAFT_1107705 [Thelephora terrestris]
MSFQIHDRCSRTEEDLEGARVLATADDHTLLHDWYPNLFESDSRASWGLLGYCTLVAVTNVLSTSFTLAMTTKLTSSRIILESNALLVSTGGLISLFWRLHVPHGQSAKESYRTTNELSSCFKSCMVGSLSAVMLSPTLACFPLLTICCFLGREAFANGTSGILLILCWVLINTLAVLFPSFTPRRRICERGYSTGPYPSSHEQTGNHDTYEKFDETDGPTFLPQQPFSACYDIFGGSLNEELKVASTFTPKTSWEETIETSGAFCELVRWAISVPTESLRPSVAAELLAIAAVSIGVCIDGMDDQNQDAQYTCLVSRTCDRLAEIFQQADPSSIPEQATNVFLFVHRFEQFDGVDVAALGADNASIPVEELKRIVCCLKSRSASLLGCGGARLAAESIR